MCIKCKEQIKCCCFCIALDLFQVCLLNGITLEAQWIPHTFKRRADLLSHFADKDDWLEHPSVFKLLIAMWGPFTIDRFASYYNSKLGRFNSIFACPSSFGVDALVQNRSIENNWLCPPIQPIVPSMSLKLVMVSALIVPEWPMSFFWPFMRASGDQCRPFIKDTFILPRISDLLLEGPGQKAVLEGKKSSLSFQVLTCQLFT